MAFRSGYWRLPAGNADLRGESNALISYGQNFEDVIIARVFDPDHEGYFVDIGAGHPTYNSVTNHFYQSGWHGLNVEPSRRLFSLLVAARPRDVTLQAIVGEAPGRATFVDQPSSDRAAAIRPDSAATPSVEGAEGAFAVEVVTLADLWQRHIGDLSVDFMRIDLGVAAAAAFAGGDWRKHRPRLLVVKAPRPDLPAERGEPFEPSLTASGYEKVWFDGLSTFYLREEDAALREAFHLPPITAHEVEPALALEMRRAAAGAASLRLGPSNSAPIRAGDAARPEADMVRDRETAETAALRASLDDEQAANAVLSALVASLDTYSQSYAEALEAEIDLRRIANRAYEDLLRDMAGLNAQLERLNAEKADLLRKYNETREPLQSAEANLNLLSRELTVSADYAGVAG